MEASWLDVDSTSVLDPKFVTNKLATTLKGSEIQQLIFQERLDKDQYDGDDHYFYYDIDDSEFLWKNLSESVAQFRSNLIRSSGQTFGQQNGQKCGIVLKKVIKALKDEHHRQLHLESEKKTIGAKSLLSVQLRLITRAVKTFQVEDLKETLTELQSFLEDPTVAEELRNASQDSFDSVQQWIISVLDTPSIDLQTKKSALETLFLLAGSRGSVRGLLAALRISQSSAELQSINLDRHVGLLNNVNKRSALSIVPDDLSACFPVMYSRPIQAAYGDVRDAEFQSSHCITSDGAYLYLYNKAVGLMKVGTGFNNTKQGEVYITQPIDASAVDGLAFVNGSLYAFIDDELHRLDAATLQGLEVGELPAEDDEDENSPEPGYITTDGKRLFALCRDFFTVKIYRFEEHTPAYESCVKLNEQQTTAVFGTSISNISAQYYTNGHYMGAVATIIDEGSYQHFSIVYDLTDGHVVSSKKINKVLGTPCSYDRTTNLVWSYGALTGSVGYFVNEELPISPEEVVPVTGVKDLLPYLASLARSQHPTINQRVGRTSARPFYVEATLLVVEEVKALLMSNKDPTSTGYLLETLATTLFYVSKQNRLSQSSNQELKTVLVKLLNEGQESTRYLAMDSLVIGWDFFMSQKEKAQFLVSLNGATTSTFYRLFYARHRSHSNLANFLGLSIDTAESTTAAITAMLNSFEAVELFGAILNSLAIDASSIQLFTLVAKHVVSHAATALATVPNVQALEQKFTVKILLRSIVDLLQITVADNFETILPLLQPLVQLAKKLDATNLKLFNAPADAIEALYRATQVQLPSQEVKESRHPCESDTDTVDIVGFPKADYMIVEFDAKTSLGPGTYLHIMNPERTVRVCPPLTDKSVFPVRLLVPGDALTLVFHTPEEMSSESWGYKCYIAGVSVPHKYEDEEDEDEEEEERTDPSLPWTVDLETRVASLVGSLLKTMTGMSVAHQDMKMDLKLFDAGIDETQKNDEFLDDMLDVTNTTKPASKLAKWLETKLLGGPSHQGSVTVAERHAIAAVLHFRPAQLDEIKKLAQSVNPAAGVPPSVSSVWSIARAIRQNILMRVQAASALDDFSKGLDAKALLLKKTNLYQEIASSIIARAKLLLSCVATKADVAVDHVQAFLISNLDAQAVHDSIKQGQLAAKQREESFGHVTDLVNSLNYPLIVNEILVAVGKAFNTRKNSVGCYADQLQGASAEAKQKLSKAFADLYLGLLNKLGTQHHLTYEAATALLTASWLPSDANMLHKSGILKKAGVLYAGDHSDLGLLVFWSVGQSVFRTSAVESDQGPAGLLLHDFVKSLQPVLAATKTTALWVRRFVALFYTLLNKSSVSNFLRGNVALAKVFIDLLGRSTEPSTTSLLMRSLRLMSALGPAVLTPALEVQPSNLPVPPNAHHLLKALKQSADSATPYALAAHGPTKMNGGHTCGEVMVSDDGYVLINGNVRTETVSLVHSDRAIPTTAKFFYYEVTIVNPGKDAAVSIGLYPAAQLPQMDGMPGWSHGSYGYHADDGECPKYNEYGLTLLGNAFNYRLEGSGAEFGPTWEKPSDVAGLFWDCETGSVAFTRNGATVGLAFHNVSGSFYPAVGLNTPTAVVAINFGQRPFAFDMKNKFGDLLALTRPLKHQREVIEAHEYESIMLVRNLLTQGPEWQNHVRNMIMESLKSIPELVKAAKSNASAITPAWKQKIDKACKSLAILGAFKDHPRIGAKVVLGAQYGVIVATDSNGKYEVMLRDKHSEHLEDVLGRYDFIAIENEHDIHFAQDFEVKPEMVPLTKELCEVFQAIIPFTMDAKTASQSALMLYSRVKMMSIKALDALVKFPQNNLDPVLQATIMPSLVQLALSPLSTTDRVKLWATEKKLVLARRYLSFLPDEDLTASAEKKAVATKAQKAAESKEDDENLSFNDKLLKIMKEGSLSFADVREIKEEFSVFDLDGDGRISLAEFILALTALGRGGDDADVETFQQMDVNNDGEVEFLEFLSFIAKKKQLEEGNVEGAIDMHVGWRCDGCGVSPIKGPRYKNANLPDFDLCDECYTTKDRLSWQIYYKVNVPLPSRRECPSSLFPVIYPPPSAVLPLLPNLYKSDKVPKPATDLVHKDVKCDLCNKAHIVGTRCKLLSKPNFNICATCEKEEAKNNPKNIYLLIETPIPEDAFSAKGSALLPDLYGSEVSKGNIAIENIRIGWRLSIARADTATQGFWIPDMSSTIGKVGIVENISLKDKYVLLRITNVGEHADDDEDDHDDDDEDEQLFWYHINSLELVDAELQRATKTEIQQQRASIEQQLAVLYSRQATFSFLKNVPATEALSLHVIGGALSLIQLLKLMILENISAASVESVDFSLKENNELKLVKERVRQILKQETVFRSLPHSMGTKNRVDHVVRKIAMHWLSLAKPRIEERKKLAGTAAPSPVSAPLPKQNSLPKMPLQGKGPGFVKGTVGPKQPLQGPLAKSNPKLPMPPTGTVGPPKIGTVKLGPKVGAGHVPGQGPSPVKIAVGPPKQPVSGGVAKLTAVFQPARIPAKVLSSGSLQMLASGSSIGSQQWMERFVVLTENSLNVKKAKPLPPMSETELKNIIAVKAAPKTLNRDHCFEVTIPNNSMIFSCESQQDQENWIKAINDASAPLRKEESNLVRVRRKASIAAVHEQPTPGIPRPASPKLQPAPVEKQPMVQPAAESGFQSKFTDMLIAECIRNLIGSLDQDYPYLVEESSHPYQNNAKFRRMIKLEGSESCCVIFDKNCHTEAGFDFCSFFEDPALTKLIGIFHGKGHQAWPTTIINSNSFWLTFETDKENPEWGYKFWVVPLAPKLTDEEMLTKPSFEFGMFVVDWLLNMEPVWVKPLYCNELFEALIKHYHKRDFAVPNRIRILTAIARLFNQWRLFDEDDRPNIGLLGMLETEVKQLYEDERKSIASTHSLYLQRMIEVLIKVNHAKQLDCEEKGQVLPDAQKLGFKKSYGFFKNGQELAGVMDKLLKGQNFSKEFINKAFMGKFRQHQGQVWVEESTHPYRPQSNLDSSITIKNATELLIEFDPRTSLVPNHAFLVLEDEQGELIERFSPTFPAQLKVAGNSFVWRFMSNRNFPDWGFRFSVTPLFNEKTAAEMQAKSEKMMQICIETLDNWTVHKDQQLVAIINAIAKFKRLHTQDSTPYGIHESVQFSLADCDTTQLAPLLQNFTMEAIEARFELLKYFNYRIGKLLPFLDLRKIVDQWSIAASLSHLRGLLFWGMKSEWLSAALQETSTNLIRPKMKLNRHAGALWRQVFKQFQKIQSQRLRQEDRAFEVIFEKEGATDIGGPYRETISQVCKEIQAEKELFVPTANNQFQLGPDQEKFVPNPSASTVASIKYFEFLGKLIGISIRTRNPLEFDWPSIVWKPLVGLKVDVEDLKNIDMNIAHLLDNIRGALAGSDGALTRETFEDVIFQSFTAKSADGRDIELRPEGQDEAVTFDNRLDFAKLLQDYKLHEFVPQVEAMIRGINQILPQQFLNILTPREVEQRVCGSRNVDINVLKSHTVYKMVDPTSQYVKFFWEAVEGFTEEQKQLLIRFVLGRSRLPADNEWPMPFALCRFLKDGDPDQFLPEAHTCFFSLDLPHYSSLEVTRDRLLYAITTCVEIDTDFVVDDEPNPFLEMLPFELQQMLM